MDKNTRTFTGLATGFYCTKKSFVIDWSTWDSETSTVSLVRIKKSTLLWRAIKTFFKPNKQ